MARGGQKPDTKIDMNYTLATCHPPTLINNLLNYSNINLHSKNILQCYDKYQTYYQLRIYLIVMFLY